MLNDYSKRKNKRLLIRISIFILVFFPPTLAIISLSLVKINLYFSPLNIISVQFLPPEGARYSYLSSLGYFKSSWKLKVEYDQNLTENKESDFFDLTLHHGPFISKNAFKNPDLTRYDRFYPIYFQIHPLNSEEKIKPDSQEYDQLLEKALELKFSWLGRLTSIFHDNNYSLIDNQSIFARDNILTLQVHFEHADKATSFNHSEFTIKESWSIFGKKSFYLDFTNKKFDHRQLPLTLSNLKMQLAFDAGEPFSDIDLNLETYIDESFLKIEGDILKVNTQEFLNLYIFDLDTLFDYILNNKLISLDKDFLSRNISQIFKKTTPQAATIYYSLTDSDFTDSLEMTYDRAAGYNLKGEYESEISQDFFALLEPLFED